MSTFSTSATTARATGISTAQRVGLVLAALYSLSNIPSFLIPGTPDGEDGPPTEILVATSVLGVIGLVAAIWAWRGNAVALRVAAGAVILMTVSGLPAFFVDVPMPVKALVAFSVLLTVLIVALLFSGRRRSAG